MAGSKLSLPERVEIGDITVRDGLQPLEHFFPTEMKVRLAEDLRRAVVEEGVRKVDAWTGRYRLARAEFDTDPVDPFFNINRPEDLAEAERLLADTQA